jgi:hypothetical protein
MILEPENFIVGFRAAFALAWLLYFVSYVRLMLA